MILLVLKFLSTACAILCVSVQHARNPCPGKVSIKLMWFWLCPCKVHPAQEPAVVDASLSEDVARMSGELEWLREETRHGDRRLEELQDQVSFFSSNSSSSTSPPPHPSSLWTEWECIV